MSIKYVGAAGGGSANVAAGAQFTVKRHPYTAVGDLQFCVITGDGNAQPPAPAGWTYSSAASDVNASGCSTFVYYRYYPAGGTDPKFTNTLGSTHHFTYMSVAYRYVKTGNPFVAVAKSHGSTAGTVGKTPTVANTLKGSLAFIVEAAKAYGPSSVNGAGLKPYNYTLLAKIAATSVAAGNDPGLVTGQAINVPIGTLGPYQAGNDSYTAANTKTHISQSSDIVMVLAPANPLPPTNVVPYNGAVVNTDVPTLSATVVASGTKARVEWQIAKDSAFTTSVVTITQPASMQRDSGATSYTIPDTSQLSQGTWYMRVRTLDENGLYSAYTSTVTFTVSHPPSATDMAPASGQGIEYSASGVALTWKFTDTSPVDYQTAYQVQVTDTTTNSVVVDSGKVTSPDQFYSMVLPTGSKGNALFWQVRLWDSDDVAGAYSLAAYFLEDDAPVVDGEIDPAELEKAYPTYTWTTTPSSGRTQASWHVTLTRVSDGALIADSGVQLGTDTQWTSPVNLKNNVYYTWDVDVVDSGGIAGSDSDTAQIAFDQPDQTTTALDASSFEAVGYIIINWTAVTDPSWSGYVIYRAAVDHYTSAGVPVWGDYIQIGRINDQSVTTFRDYYAGAKTEYKYGVAVEATRFGDPVESDLIVAQTPAGGWENSNYWLIHPTDHNYDVKLPHVSSNSYSEDFEEEVFSIPGQGRKIDIGYSQGRAEQLTCKLYDIPGGPTATMQRRRLQSLRAERTAYYYRNPFGDGYSALIGNVSGSRTGGTGSHEYSEVSFDVREVS